MLFFSLLPNILFTEELFSFDSLAVITAFGSDAVLLEQTSVSIAFKLRIRTFIPGTTNVVNFTYLV